MSRALPPTRSSSPRDFADSSEVKVGSWWISRKGTFSRVSQSRRVVRRSEGMVEWDCGVHAKFTTPAIDTLQTTSPDPPLPPLPKGNRSTLAGQAFFFGGRGGCRRGEPEGFDATAGEKVRQVLVAGEKQDLQPLPGEFEQELRRGRRPVFVEIHDHVVENHRQRNSLGRQLADDR